MQTYDIRRDAAQKSAGASRKPAAHKRDLSPILSNLRQGARQMSAYGQGIIQMLKAEPVADKWYYIDGHGEKMRFVRKYNDDYIFDSGMGTDEVHVTDKKAVLAPVKEPARIEDGSFIYHLSRVPPDTIRSSGGLKPSNSLGKETKNLGFDAGRGVRSTREEQLENDALALEEASGILKNDSMEQIHSLVEKRYAEIRLGPKGDFVFCAKSQEAICSYGEKLHGVAALAYVYRWRVAGEEYYTDDDSVGAFKHRGVIPVERLEFAEMVIPEHILDPVTFPTNWQQLVA